MNSNAEDLSCLQPHFLKPPQPTHTASYLPSTRINHGPLQQLPESLPPHQFLIKHPTQTPGQPVSPALSLTQRLSPAQAPAQRLSPAQAPAQAPAQRLSPAQAPAQCLSPAQAPAQHLSPAQAPAQHLSPAQAPAHCLSLAQASSPPPPSAQAPAQPSPPVRALVQLPLLVSPPSPRLLIRSTTLIKILSPALPPPSTQFLITPLPPAQTLPPAQPLLPAQTLPPAQPLLPAQTLPPAQPLLPAQTLPPAQPLLPAQTLPPAQPLLPAQTLPPAQPLLPAQTLPPAQPLLPAQTLPPAQNKSLCSLHSLVQSLPESLSVSLTEPLSMAAHTINIQRHDQGKSHVSRNNSAKLKYFQSWMVQSEESLQKQHAAFHKASFGQVLFCCFTLDSEWFFCLEEIGLPVRACRDELKNCLTYEDLDCMLLIEDIFTTLIHLTKNHAYLVKMMDAVEKIEMAVLKDIDMLVEYLLEKAKPLQIVQQTWNEVFDQSDASEQKKVLTLFLMKLYQQHVKNFDNAINSWEKIRNLSIQDTYIADTLQEKGEEQLKNGNLEDALGFFNEAINNCPLDVKSYKQRAKIHEMLENYKLSSCDLIRVHVLEPDWEEGYVIHDKILKNLDDRWTRYCFKLIDKWKVGANYYYIIETVQEDTPEKENDCISPSPVEEKKNEEKCEEKIPLPRNDSDELVEKAMNLYKQQKFKEMLQLFKANILETTLYQLGLLSLIHLKRLDEARQLASTAIQTFTDSRQFSGDVQEVTNLKKMFNFIKSLPPTSFGQCDICKTGQQSSVADIYIYEDFSMLDDLFHKGFVVLRCENRCRILFHFECLSGSNDFIWKMFTLQNYIRTICSTPDCQSYIIMAEAFFVDNTESIKVVDSDLGFKRQEIVNPTGLSITNLTAQNPEPNNNVTSTLTSSDEATLPSDNSDGSTPDTNHASGQAHAAGLNEKRETKSPPSYKTYERKKTGKNKKRRSEKKAPLLESFEFCVDDINSNQNLTNGFQPETNEDTELQQFFSESSEEIEKENLLLYLCSVLHEHGPQSASGEIFQNEIKALKDNHKKLLSKSGGLASFLLQSNNVLLKDPDILFLEADTLTTVIPATDQHPLQLHLSQESASGEDLASNTCPLPSFIPEMSASGYDNQEEYAAPRRGSPVNESISTLQNPVYLTDADFAIREASDPEFVGAQCEKPNNVSASVDEPSMVPTGPPKLDSVEGIKRRNLPPDKREMNILDHSSSELEESSSISGHSEQEKETEEEEENDFFYSYSEESPDSLDSSDSEFPYCEFCEHFKPRLVFLEEECKNILLKYNDERRNCQRAQQKISSLEAQLEALKEENANLRKIIDDADYVQSMEASNIPTAMVSRSILRTGRRSLPPHLKGLSKQLCEPNVETVPMNKQDINLCVICHEDLLLLTVNTLQCGHVFHDNCIRKWFLQQKTCPSCRKHTLLTEEFPPLA